MRIKTAVMMSIARKEVPQNALFTGAEHAGEAGYKLIDEPSDQVDALPQWNVMVPNFTTRAKWTYHALHRHSTDVY